MILNDHDLKEWAPKMFDPFNEDHIQPASYEVCLDRPIIKFKGEVAYVRNTGSGEDFQNFPMLPLDFKGLGDDYYWYEYSDDYHIIKPNEFFLATTIEKIIVPIDIAARIEGKSSIGRLGLTVHATAGWIDPGFVGKVTLECQNNLQRSIKIYTGMKIAQIAFMELTSNAERPYGSDGLGSKYQGQEQVAPSRLKLE